MLIIRLINSIQNVFNVGIKKRKLSEQILRFNVLTISYCDGLPHDYTQWFLFWFTLSFVIIAITRVCKKKNLYIDKLVIAEPMSVNCESISWKNLLWILKKGRKIYLLLFFLAKQYRVKCSVECSFRVTFFDVRQPGNGQNLHCTVACLKI